MTMLAPFNLTESISSRIFHTSLFFCSASNASPLEIGASSPHLDLLRMRLTIVCYHSHHHLPFLPSTLPSVTLTRYKITSELLDGRHKCCLLLSSQIICNT